MKKLLLVLSGLCVVTGAYAADETTEFKWDAEMRTRFVGENNKMPFGQIAVSPTAPVAQNDFEQRNKLGVKMTRGEKLAGYVQLLQNMSWGANLSGLEIPGNPQQTKPKDGFEVYQAWGWWKNSENLSFKFGRMALNVGDGSLIGNNDWFNNPQAFEGVGAILDYDFGRIMIAGVKAATLLGGANNTDPGAVMYGVSYDAKNMPDIFKMTNLTILQTNQDESGLGFGASTLRYDLVLAGETNNLDFKAGYAGLSGKTTAGSTSTTNSGYMVQAAVGYKMPEMMNFHVGLSYHMDSGDDHTDLTKTTTYNGFFYNQHGSEGSMDPFQWGNLTFIKADVMIDPWETTTLGLTYTIYSRTNAKDDVSFLTNPNTATVAGVPVAAASKAADLNVDSTDTALATELDVYAHYKVSNDFKLTAYYGMLTAGAAMTQNGKVTIANDNRFFFQGTLNF